MENLTELLTHLTSVWLSMEDKPGQGGGLSMEEGVKLGGRQGAHVMIWAPLDDKLGFLGKYPCRAAVLVSFCNILVTWTDL